MHFFLHSLWNNKNSSWDWRRLGWAFIWQAVRGNVDLTQKQYFTARTPCKPSRLIAVNNTFWLDVKIHKCTHKQRKTPCKPVIWGIFHSGWGIWSLTLVTKSYLVGKQIANLFEGCGHELQLLKFMNGEKGNDWLIFCIKRLSAKTTLRQSWRASPAHIASNSWQMDRTLRQCCGLNPNPNTILQSEGK